MPSYIEFTAEQAEQEMKSLEARLSGFAEQKLKLNMTRGKPCTEQLDLCNGLMTSLGEQDYNSKDGTD